MAAEKHFNCSRRTSLIMGAGLAILYGLFLILVLPWWNAVNHPVFFKLGAPASADIQLSFETGEAPLPLVPIGDTGEHHQDWATELPPRPGYRLFLEFPRGTGGKITLSEVKLLTLSPERRERILELAGIVEGGDKETLLDIRREGDGWTIQAAAGARLFLAEISTQQGPLQLFKNWASATLAYLITAGVVILLLQTVFHFPYQLKVERRRIPQWETYVLIGAILLGVTVNLILVSGSLPRFWFSDSIGYAMKAASLAAEGSYDTGSYEYELNRLPGYPLFMAAVFRLADWNLNAVTLGQSIFFCLSICLLTVSLRPLVRNHYLGIVAFLALISPPAIWASRQIATESVFSGIWALSLAAFLFLWRRDGPWRWIGWLMFGTGVMAAVSMRPNGILLMALPGCIGVGTLLRAMAQHKASFYRSKTLWSTAGQVLVPSLMVVAFVLAWSLRNHESRGYAKPTDMTEITYANAPFYSGIFDIRAARDRKEYDWIMNERVQTNFFFHGWHLRRYLFDKVTDNKTRFSNTTLSELEQELAGFNASSSEWIPARAKLAGRTRMAFWGLFFPRVVSHTTEGIQLDYAVETDFIDEQDEEYTRLSLAWATPGRDKTISISGSPPSVLSRLYNSGIAPLYQWIYRALLFAGILLWFLSLRRGNFLVAALLLPFFLNIYLNIYFMVPISRYVQPLDAALMMACLAGLHGHNFCLLKR